MADREQSSPFRRCSTDPVYLSSHFYPHPEPQFCPRAPAAFHKTSLQARNYLTPPSSSAASSPTDSDGGLNPPPIASADDDDRPSDSTVIPAQVSTRIESWHQRRPSFEPLWEESDTFSPSKVSEFRELGRSVNALAETVRSLCTGGYSNAAPRNEQLKATDQSNDEQQEASPGRRKGSGCFWVSLSPILLRLLYCAGFAIVILVASRHTVLHRRHRPFVLPTTLSRGTAVVIETSLCGCKTQSTLRPLCRGPIVSCTSSGLLIAGQSRERHPPVSAMKCCCAAAHLLRIAVVPSYRFEPCPDIVC
jgi:hypothetical protein